MPFDPETASPTGEFAVAGGRRRYLALLVLAGVLLGGLFLWWMGARADAELRAGLLQRARLAAKPLDPALVVQLLGSLGDGDSPAFREVQSSLQSFLLSDPEFRYVYLMGARPGEGGAEVFFLADTQDSSTDVAPPSPPGSPYDDATDELKGIFSSGQPIVEGPAADQWGVWISALVPVTDPETGKVLAVFGVDVDARAWRLAVVAKVVIPAAAVALLLIALVAVYLASWRIKGEPKPLVRLLMPPLVAMFLAIIGAFGVLMVLQQKWQLESATKAEVDRVLRELASGEGRQALMMGAVAESLIETPHLRAALAARDRKALQEILTPAFVRLCARQGVDFGFVVAPDFECLLRLHDPEESGDVLEHYSLHDARRRGGAASNIYAGPSGEVALRVAVPVMEGGDCLGYVELGQSLADLLAPLHLAGKVELVALRRDPAAGEEARIPRDVAASAVIYSSLNPLPDDMAALLARQPADGTASDAELGGSAWSVVGNTLRDGAGKPVADLFVFRCAAAADIAFLNLLTLVLAGSLVLAALVSGTLFVILRRTDRSIAAQQARLRESEARYRVLFDAAPDAHFILKDGVFADCNRAAVEMLRAGREKIIGSTPAEISPEKQPGGRFSADVVREQLLAAEGGEPIRFEWLHRRPDGTEFWSSVSLARIAIDGEPMLITTMRDISERKKAEEELAAATRRTEEALVLTRELVVKAEAASRAKSQFLANMSHELRTPMNGVLGMTELLLSSGLTPSQQELAELAHSSATSLLSLLSDILDISKIEAGRVDLEHIPFDLSRLLAAIGAIMGMTARQKGLAFDARIDPHVPVHLVGDPIRLRQILNNLIGNAIKFTHAGSVDVGVSLAPGTDASGAVVRLRFSVRDTGIGVPESARAHIFGKFSQADASTTRRYGGSGLGLAISLQLVELMGGQIGIKSEEGVGSEFFFTANFRKAAQQ